jgi:hypothetical protein
VTTANGDYQYEIFVSYRRQPPMSAWVQQYFYDELTQWLGSELPDAPRVFIDVEGIDTGDDWPARIRSALLGSCLLVAVWSPDYFRSHWCVAELHTMLARERALKLRTNADPRGLVFPIKFTDGQYFPADVSNIQFRDFSNLAYTAPAFRDSPKYLDFQTEVRDFVQTLAQRLVDAPPWEPNWPVHAPAPSGEQTAPLPRL